MEDLLLVDGCSLAATSFYGTVPAAYHKVDAQDPIAVEKVLKDIEKDKNGTNLNAVKLFFKVLGNAIRIKNFKNLVITWDVTRDTFRRDIYPEYKQNRGSKDLDLIKQENLIKELLKVSDIPSIYNKNYEADDLIGTLANKFKDKYNVYILSKDRDLYQLIDDNVYLWLKTKNSYEMYFDRNLDYTISPNGYYQYTKEELKELEGINHPNYVKDIKALAGDVGDNIPGVKGVGEKTAIPLINYFTSLENLYTFLKNNEEKEVKKKFKEIGIVRTPYKALMEGEEMAFISKILASIVTDALTAEDMTEEDIKLNINNNAFIRRCNELNIDMSN